ncbi:MAG: dehypoxanthine futalosine cyclase, partial [Selenomonadales bacterium]|nr:dehypoxanthine futalosine cyclase [Selenomonadales bacterium]
MRYTEKQGIEMLTSGDPIALGREANAIREKLFGNTVTFIVDRNINYTNVCKNECKFCAFFRRKESKDAYLLTIEEILQKVQETVDAGGTQVM